MKKRRIYDPIHGFISLYSWEEKVIETLPFKRLQAIHQIGAAGYIYAGGNHKRYEHSLGTMHVTSQIYDKALSQSLMDEVPKYGSDEYYYWKKCIRLGALLHDVGHMPYSHLAEKMLLDEKGHEGWTLRLIRSHYFQGLFKEIGVDGEHVAKLSVSPHIYDGEYTPFEHMLNQMLTDDNMGGDRIDYLLRDAYYTGLAYGSFDYQQMLESVRVLEQEDKLYLGIEEGGLEAAYALLLARHFMFRRLYHHPKVKSYHFHLSRFIKEYLKDTPFLYSVDQYIRYNDFTVLAEVNWALFDPKHRLHREAECIMDQSPRVTVFGVAKEKIQPIVDRLQIPLDDLFVEENLLFIQQPRGPFLVLGKNGTITDGRQFFQIETPLLHNSWMYVSPVYTNKVKDCLEHDNHNMAPSKE